MLVHMDTQKSVGIHDEERFDSSFKLNCKSDLPIHELILPIFEASNRFPRTSTTCVVISSVHTLHYMLPNFSKVITST